MGKAEKTRQFIIEQAATLFNQKEIAGTSIDDVLKVTKVAKGCLYGHFENKEALALAMVDYLLARITNRTAVAMSAEPSAKGKLMAMLSLYKTPNSPLLNGGCPILNFGVESDDTNPVIKQKVKTVIQDSIRNITLIIKSGIKEKEFSADFNAEEFALKMFTLIEGGMLISRVTDTNKHMNMMLDMLKSEISGYALN